MYKTYNKAIAGLYGKEPPETKPKPATKRQPKSVVPTEKQEQQRLIQWWLHKYPLWADLLVHVANERVCTPFQGADFKRSGVRKGMVDLILFIPRGSHGALLIEMKRKHGGVVSFAQMEMLERLRKQGYKAEVCYGCDEAIKTITEYLTL